MALENSLNKIKEFIHNRYKNNLAGLLVYGTANTGNFIEGKSDIDTMIFLKKLGNLELGEESNYLFNKLESEHFATQYFHTIDSIKNYIADRTSFSTYITIVSDDGSKVLYSTPEFEKLKDYLRNNPPSKDSIKEYIKEKDKFELDGYFRDTDKFTLTKSLFAHLRRKLQIINYLQNNSLIFDFDKCLDNINLGNNEKRKLKNLYGSYKNRESIPGWEIRPYYNLAKQLTKKIIEM